MNETPISLPVMDTIKTAWSKVKGSKSTFWAVFGCVVLIHIAIALFDVFTYSPEGVSLLSPGMTFLSRIAMFLLYVLGTMLIWGVIYISIKRAMDQPIQFNQVKYVFDIEIFLKMVGVTILRVIILIPTGILLVLPMLFGNSVIATIICYVVFFFLALYLSVRMMLSQWLVIGKRLNPWAAIKESFKATESHVLELIGIVLLMLLIYIISALPLLIGLIWSLPLLFLIMGEIYKTLVK